MAGRLLVFFAAVLLFAADFLVGLFFAALLFAEVFFAAVLFAPAFLAVLFFAAPLAAFLAGDFLAVDFLAADFREVDFDAALLELLLEDFVAVLEPPRPVERRLEAALLRPVDLDAVRDLVLPPALLEEVFLEAVFLVDFAIVNGF